jgi:3-oxoacyl-[acyl-carrier protein] reductase
MPMAAPYGAAKAGLINLAQTVAAEYGRQNVRMNVVSCGQIATEASASGITTNMWDRVPMGRAGLPAEIAEAVIFLASRRSSFITGQALTVDGGAVVHFPLATMNADISMAG